MSRTGPTFFISLVVLAFALATGWRFFWLLFALLAFSLIVPALLYRRPRPRFDPTEYNERLNYARPRYRKVGNTWQRIS
jgi:hypothetical protein